MKVCRRSTSEPLVYGHHRSNRYFKPIRNHHSMHHYSVFYISGGPLFIFTTQHRYYFILLPHTMFMKQFDNLFHNHHHHHHHHLMITRPFPIIFSLLYNSTSEFSIHLALDEAKQSKAALSEVRLYICFCCTAMAFVVTLIYIPSYFLSYTPYGFSFPKARRFGEKVKR